jgi:hypothetical protein
MATSKRFTELVAGLTGVGQHSADHIARRLEHLWPRPGRGASKSAARVTERHAANYVLGMGVFGSLADLARDVEAFGALVPSGVSESMPVGDLHSLATQNTYRPLVGGFGLLSATFATDAERAAAAAEIWPGATLGEALELLVLACKSPGMRETLRQAFVSLTLSSDPLRGALTLRRGAGHVTLHYEASQLALISQPAGLPQAPCPASRSFPFEFFAAIGELLAGEASQDSDPSGPDDGPGDGAADELAGSDAAAPVASDNQEAKTATPHPGRGAASVGSTSSDGSPGGLVQHHVDVASLPVHIGSVNRHVPDAAASGGDPSSTEGTPNDRDLDTAYRLAS